MTIKVMAALAPGNGSLSDMHDWMMSSLLLGCAEQKRQRASLDVRNIMLRAVDNMASHMNCIAFVKA